MTLSVIRPMTSDIDGGLMGIGNHADAWRIPMAQTMSLTTAFGARPAASAAAFVPTTRPVPSLRAALRAVLRQGGTVTSETRTAPGIGSWAFVVDAHGREAVLWEDAAALAG